MPNAMKNLSLEVGTDRFGNKFFIVVDEEGYSVATYLEENEKQAIAHVKMGKRPNLRVTPSLEVMRLFR